MRGFTRTLQTGNQNNGGVPFNLDVFAAHQAAFTCMRVEPGHGNARTLNAQLLQPGMGNEDGVDIID